MVSEDIYEIMEELKLTLGDIIDEINEGKREEDTALLNAFLDEITYYEKLLKK